MKPLVERMQEVVDRMSREREIFYLFGHRLEIANRLLEKDKDSHFMHRKYPLLALRQDFEERISNGVISYNLNLAIIEYTDKNYTAEDRYKHVFKPVLYPLYSSFINALRQSGFMWNGWQNAPPHTKIDRPFWGVAQGDKNVKNIFSDPIDAVEIVDLRINLINC